MATKLAAIARSPRTMRDSDSRPRRLRRGRTALAPTTRPDAVALCWIWPRETESRRGPRSDRSGEFGERGRDATAGTDVNAEFVVTAPNVLHQRMTAHDHPR